MVSGFINANCTQQVATSAYTVTTNGSNGCLIEFPNSTFTSNPVLILTPIGSETIASIVEGYTSTWFAQYTLSGPSETVNFVAVQSSS